MALETVPDASGEDGCGAAGSSVQQSRIQPTAAVTPATPVLANMSCKTSSTTLSHSEIEEPAKFYPFLPLKMAIYCPAERGEISCKKFSFPSLLTSAASSSRGRPLLSCAHTPDLLPLVPLCPLAVIFLSIGRRSR